MRPPTQEQTGYRVTSAKNLSRDSDNKIHDDDVAKQLGYRGGLVAGAEIAACMAQDAVDRWGTSWLAAGTLSARLRRPVYDGSALVIACHGDEHTLKLGVSVAGETCATGLAFAGGSAHPQAAIVQALDRPRDAPSPPRLPANECTLAPGTFLPTMPFRMETLSAEYLAAAGETDSIYGINGLVHPGLIIRLCNRTISDNVVLGPWIHTASNLTMFAQATVTKDYCVSGVVSRNYTRNGHQYAEVDVAVVSNDGLVATARHEVIYQLGRVDESGALRLQVRR